MSKPPETRSWWKRWRFPIIVLLFPVFFIILELLWEQNDWNPGMLMPVNMAMTISVMLAPVIILVWFFLIARFSRLTRILVLLLLLLFAGAAFALVRLIEFDGKMRPIVYFRWDELPQDHLLALQVGPLEVPLDASVGSEDSPYFRGMYHDGTTPGSPENSDWARQELQKLWQFPIGGGHAGISVGGMIAVTIEQRNEYEVIVAYDSMNGKARWVHQYQSKFHHSEPMGGDGPRTTPVIYQGMVYVLGAQGHLHCLQANTGKVMWSTNILVDAGARNLEWGMSGSPLIVQDRIYVNPGIDPEKNTDRAVICYDRLTGKQIWARGSDGAGYASLMNVKLAGVDQLLQFDAAGLKGIDLNDGKQLWLYPWRTSFDMNCAQPIVTGEDTVFLSSEVSNGGALVKVSQEGGQWKVNELWKTRYMGIKFTNAVLHEGHIYGLSNGYLTCINVKTGERIWKARQSYGNGQVLIAGSVLVITTEQGQLALAEANPVQFTELKRLPVFSGRTWNVPAIARGRLYMRNHQEMACIKLW